MKNIEEIVVEEFTFQFIDMKNPRIEAQLLLNKEDLVPKFLYKLMELSHLHGFGCSAPFFYESGASVSLFIGTKIEQKYDFDFYAQKLLICIREVKKFIEYFSNQINFSNVDISMFTDIDPNYFYPDQLATIRDQNYQGSWNGFIKDIENNTEYDTQLIKKCIDFEKINNKDLGFVGLKLSSLLLSFDAPKIFDN
jgi:hypothetical protein